MKLISTKVICSNYNCSYSDLTLLDFSCNCVNREGYKNSLNKFVRIETIEYKQGYDEGYKILIPNKPAIDTLNNYEGEV